ncbi:endoplasmic reticulum resident protein 27 [Arapaima gigas]
MLFSVLLPLMCISAFAKDEDHAITRLGDVSAAAAFVNSSEVVIIGFFESEDRFGYKEFVTAVSRVKDIPVALCDAREVWSAYNVTSDTISIFRKADLHQENLQLSNAKTLDSDGLERFFSTNDLRYITEYDAVTAVGLFHSKVKTHLVLLANKGSKTFSELKRKMKALAPEFTGKFLFVLVNGALKSNERSLGYFGLKPNDLPRVGIYDIELDRQWLLPPGEITTQRVRDFCHSFLVGELQVRPWRSMHSGGGLTSPEDN